MKRTALVTSAFVLVLTAFVAASVVHMRSAPAPSAKTASHVVKAAPVAPAIASAVAKAASAAEAAPAETVRAPKVAVHRARKAAPTRRAQAVNAAPSTDEAREAAERRGAVAAEIGDSTDGDREQKAKPTDAEMAKWTYVKGAAVTPVLSPPLRDVPAVRTNRDPHAENENFDLPYRGLTGSNGPARPDTAVQSHFGPNAPTPTGVNFPGIGVNGSAPSDDNGHVGPNHYVQWVNSQFAIYDKSGTVLYGPANGNTLFTSLGGVCAAQNNGDPIAQYDILSDRWVLSQFAVSAPPTGLASHQCVAVSVTGDPLGAYYLYDFPLSPTLLFDYPHMATWLDSYYTTFHIFDVTLPPGTQFQNLGIVAFERPAMLLGLPARAQIGSLGTAGAGEFFGGLPADIDSLTPPPPGSLGYVIAPASPEWDGTPTPGIHFWTLFTTWGAIPGMTITQLADIVTAPFDTNLCNFSRQCITQPPPAVASDRVDSLTGRFMYRVAYRNNAGTESLLATHTVNALTFPSNLAALRWYEIRNPATTPTVFQQGTFAPDANHRWTGSIAMDNTGNIAMGYSKSSATILPEIDVTGRLVGDAPGTMGAEVVMKSGVGVQQVTANRWGDYSGMSLDPRDQCTFWYTNQYIPVTGQFTWGTQIGSFRFPPANCTPPPKGTLTGTVRDGSGNPISGAVVQLDNGFSAATNDAGIYTLVTSPGTYNVGITAALRPGCNPPPGSVVVIPNGGVATRNFNLFGTPTIAFDSVAIDDSIGNNNGVINRNECVIINVGIGNIGCAPATGISAVLSTTTPEVTVTSSSSTYGTLPAGTNGSNVSPFQITTSAAFACGTPIDFTLTVTSSAGATPVNFSLQTCQAAATVIPGSINGTEPQENARMGRNQVASSCFGKACPGPLGAGTRHFDAYNFANIAPDARCITVTLGAACAPASNGDIFSVAYVGTFDPTNLCLNYVGDVGGSPLNGISAPYRFTIPAGQNFVVIVNESTANVGCSNYTLTVNGLLDNTDGGRPAAPTAGNDGPVCGGGTLSLTATTVPGATYSWTGPNGFTSNLQNPTIPNITAAGAGTYSVIATVGGCTSDAGTTNVTVNPTPAAPTAGSNSPVPVGGTINLTATLVAGATYAWTGPNSFTSSAQNPSIPLATSAMAGVYSVTVTLGGCTSLPGTTTVVISDLAAVSIAVDAAAATGTSSNVNSVFESGETVQVNTGWKNNGTTAASPTGLFSNFTGPVGPTYTITDATADYGPISPSAQTNCATATGDCYLLTVSGARPTAHWDTTVLETLSDGSTHTWTLHIGNSFTDVPTSSAQYRFVETIFHKGITGGCSAGLFCPANPVTRAQDAVFVLMGEHGTGYTPPPAVGLFLDVPASSPFAPWVEQLVAEGITAGCGGGNFCPSTSVTRAQSAVFLLKAEHGTSYVPPPAVGLFADVPASSPFAPWVEQMVAEGITAGCGGGNFCPGLPVTRGQNAVFLTTTFKLKLYIP